MYETNGHPHAFPGFHAERPRRRSNRGFRIIENRDNLMCYLFPGCLVSSGGFTRGRSRPSVPILDFVNGFKNIGELRDRRTDTARPHFVGMHSFNGFSRTFVDSSGNTTGITGMRANGYAASASMNVFESHYFRHTSVTRVLSESCRNEVPSPDKVGSTQHNVDKKRNSDQELLFRRDPCISNWKEIESYKTTNIADGRTHVYLCTYCNVLLSNNRKYVEIWPEVLYCGNCRRIPQCNSCYKKAVMFKYIGPDGSKCYEPPLLNWGGINLCGQCALLNPVLNEDKLGNMVEAAFGFLSKYFGISFNDKIAHFSMSSDEIKALGYFENGRFVKSKPVSRVSGCLTQVLFVSEPPNRNEIFPIEIIGVSLNQISPNPMQHVYGRCQSMVLVSHSGRKENGSIDMNDPKKRSYKIVQRILVSQGLPESLFCAYLVHELVHAYVHVSRKESDGNVHDDVEEGLCNCIMAAFIQQRIETLKKQRNRFLSEMFSRNLKPSTNPKKSELTGNKQTTKLWRIIQENAFIPNVDNYTPNPSYYHMPNAYVKYNFYVCEYEMKVLYKKLAKMEINKNASYGYGYRAVRELFLKVPTETLIQSIGKNCTYMNSTNYRSTKANGCD